MKISVKLEASQCTGSTTLTLDQLGFSLEEWEQLGEEDKSEAIKNAVYDLNDQPFWMVDSYIEKQ